jgi:hypothetical protein
MTRCRRPDRISFSPTRRPVARLLAVVALLVCGSASASDGTFDFLVDRFTVDGGGFGPLDGVPDRVDDFDGDVLTGWVKVNGTAFERDGFLHLASPGDHVADGFGAVPGLPLDISQVYYAQRVTRDAGDFRVDAAWWSTVLHYGDFNHLSVFAYADPSNPYGQYEVVGVALSDPTPDDASAAYSATRFVVRFLGGKFEPVATDSVPVDPATISGEVVLRHAFDATTDSVTTAISLDGGTTFSEPFAPVSLFTATANAVFLLGSDPIAVPSEPGSSQPAPGLCRAGVLVPRTRLAIRSRARSLSINGTAFAAPATIAAYDPRRDGLQVRLQRGTDDAMLLDLTATAIPPGARGSGCAAGDGWRSRHGVDVYRNVSNALPPDCRVGSAGGLRTLRIDRRPAERGRFEVHARVAGVGSVTTGPVELTLVLGRDASAGSAGRCGVQTVFCVARGARVRCS